MRWNCRSHCRSCFHVEEARASHEYEDSAENACMIVDHLEQEQVQTCNFPGERVLAFKQIHVLLSFVPASSS